MAQLLLEGTRDEGERKGRWEGEREGGKQAKRKFQELPGGVVT